MNCLSLASFIAGSCSRGSTPNDGARFRFPWYICTACSAVGTWLTLTRTALLFVQLIWSGMPLPETKKNYKSDFHSSKTTVNYALFQLFIRYIRPKNVKVATETSKIKITRNRMGIPGTDCISNTNLDNFSCHGRNTKLCDFIIHVYKVLIFHCYKNAFDRVIGTRVDFHPKSFNGVVL